MEEEERKGTNKKNRNYEKEEKHVGPDRVFFMLGMGLGSRSTRLRVTRTCFVRTSQGWMMLGTKLKSTAPRWLQSRAEQEASKTQRGGPGEGTNIGARPAITGLQSHGLNCCSSGSNEIHWGF